MNSNQSNLIIAKKIAKDFKKKLGNSVSQIYLYGSSLSKYSLANNSDIDLLIIIKKSDFNFFKKLQATRLLLEKKYKVKIGLGWQLISDLTQENISQNLFVHRNRSFELVNGINYAYPKLLPITSKKLPILEILSSQIRVESYRLLKSHRYLVEKAILRVETANFTLKEFVKVAIFSPVYIFGFFGYNLSLDQAIERLASIRPDLVIKINKFLAIKKSGYTTDSDQTMKELWDYFDQVIKYLDDSKDRLLKSRVIVTDGFGVWYDEARKINNLKYQKAGSVDWQSLDEQVKKGFLTYEQAVARSKLSIQQKLHYIKSFKATAGKYWQSKIGAKATLKVFSNSKRRIYLLTDTRFDLEQLNFILKRLELKDYFDKIITSRQVHGLKTDKATFLKVLKNYKLTAKDIVFVGHDDQEISTASCCGILTIGNSQSKLANWNFGDHLSDLERLFNL